MRHCTKVTAEMCEIVGIILIVWCEVSCESHTWRCVYQELAVLYNKVCVVKTFLTSIKQHRCNCEPVHTADYTVGGGGFWSIRS